MFKTSSLLLALSTILLSTACQAQPKVTISTREGRELTFEVELADTPVKRELGFQYRRGLAANPGMIFLFSAEAEHPFWMKNTPIPLDMAFITNDRHIIGIAGEAAPLWLESRA